MEGERLRKKILRWIKTMGVNDVCSGFFGRNKSDFCFFQAILPISLRSRIKSAVKFTKSGRVAGNYRLMGRKTELAFYFFMLQEEMDSSVAALPL